ncbi:MAG: DsrE family protein [Planctomycetota bacterium]
MTKYLLIESRDPFESRGVAGDLELATNLARDGNEVTLFLVQNGVLETRRDARMDGLDSVLASGVEVLADEFSLRERGIRQNELIDGIKPSALDIVVDQLAEGRRTIWL